MPIGNRLEFYAELIPPTETDGVVGKAHATRVEVLDAVADALYAQGRLEVPVTVTTDDGEVQETWTARLVDVDWLVSETSKERIDKVAELVGDLSGVGGAETADELQWIIDQMLRTLLGPVAYQVWCKRFEEEHHGDEWSPGAAPTGL